MQTWQRIVAVGAMCILGAVVPARGYEVLLDIDTDDDPTTLNMVSQETLVTVKIVLSPSVPGEEITDVFFGLGGTCWECEGVFDYGTDFDLFPPDGNWTSHPELRGSWDAAMCIGCCGSPGFHYIYQASAINGSVSLEEPVFIASFAAWKSEPMWGRCPVPPSNLAAFFEPGNFWNYIQIGGSAPIATGTGSWGRLKADYER
jgi:hypothetical protein